MRSRRSDSTSPSRLPRSSQCSSPASQHGGSGRPPRRRLSFASRLASTCRGTWAPITTDRSSRCRPTANHSPFAAPEAPTVVRFQVGIDVQGHLGANYNRQVLAMSPDGKRLAFGGDRLYVRELGDAEPRAVPGSEGFASIGLPAFSPDSQSLVFWAATDRSLKRVTLGSPAITTVTELNEGGYGL